MTQEKFIIELNVILGRISKIKESNKQNINLLTYSINKSIQLIDDFQHYHPERFKPQTISFIIVRLGLILDEELPQLKKITHNEKHQDILLMNVISKAKFYLWKIIFSEKHRDL